MFIQRSRRGVITDFVIEKERKSPVYAECDVLVVGGGVAGVAAAYNTKNQTGMANVPLEYLNKNLKSK